MHAIHTTIGDTVLFRRPLKASTRLIPQVPNTWVNFAGFPWLILGNTRYTWLHYYCSAASLWFIRAMQGFSSISFRFPLGGQSRAWKVWTDFVDSRVSRGRLASEFSEPRHTTASSSSIIRHICRNFSMTSQQVPLASSRHSYLAHHVHTCMSPSSTCLHSSFHTTCNVIVTSWCCSFFKKNARMFLVGCDWARCHNFFRHRWMWRWHSVSIGTFWTIAFFLVNHFGIALLLYTRESISTLQAGAEKWKFKSKGMRGNI